jgi:hypothetical protein
MKIVAYALGASLALSPSLARAATLPLRRVVLYETGVGYFERQGSFDAQRGTALPVPTGHLDDALKTLVVLDGGSGATKARVTSIEFSSSVSPGMGRALAGLPEDEDPLSYEGLLRSLKGAGVEIATGQEKLRGRLVEVLSAEESGLERCVAVPEPGKACALRKEAAVVVLGERGELRRLLVADLTSVRPTDRALSSRIGAALDSLGERSAQVRRELEIRASGGKPIALAYIAEAPVWRATYRVVLDDSAAATLQGWALVHNDTDENWQSVRVELVNGQPDSFLFPLAAPRYRERELVTPEQELSTVPQLLHTTVDSMWGDEMVGSFGSGHGTLGGSGYGEGGGGRGEGIGLGAIGTVGNGGASSLLSVGNLAAVSSAAGAESGALFSYTLAAPVDLRAHASALLPFVQERVRASRIAWFEAPGKPARSALQLKNDTRQTLPAGTLAIFSDGAFSGESAIQRTKPGEARIVRYGFDLDVELTAERGSYSDEPRLLGYKGEALVEHFVRKHRLSYKLENRSGSARSVYAELAFVNNARVTGADRLDYDAERKKALAVFELPPKKQLTRKLAVDEGLYRRHAFAKLTAARLRDFAKRREVPAAQRAVVNEAAELLWDAEVRAGARAKRRAELTLLEVEIARIQATLAAMGTKNIRGAEKLVARVLEAEAERRKLVARIQELGVEIEQRRNRAKRALQKLPRA